MSKLTQFARFAGRYAGELRSVAGFLSGILNMIPANPAERSDLSRILDDLTAAADRIEESIPGILDGGISRDEIKAVLRGLVIELLPDIIGGLSEKNTRAAVAGAVVAKPKRVRAKAKASTGD